MARRVDNKVLLLGIITMLLACIKPQTSPEMGPYHRVCLIDQESQYRPDGGRFRISDVTDPSLCTHIVYGPVLVDGETAGLMAAGAYDEDNWAYLISMKASNPNLSVLLSVGGPNDGSLEFEAIANDTETVERFAYACLDFVRERSLDGILIDWSPVIKEDVQGHLENFTTLLETISNTFRADVSQTGRSSLLFSVVISGDRDTIETFYPVQAISQYADFILVRTYDFYTEDLPIIGHQSALYPRSDDEGYFTVLNLDFAVRFLLYLDVPSYKLIVGIPSHGRTLRFVNESLQYFGAEHIGPGSPGPYSQQNGMLAYYEICDLLATGWLESFHEEHQVPFAFSDEEMVTYDNSQSIVNKVNYVKDNQLGGLFISSLADDDFIGTFCVQGTFPLMKTIKSTLEQSRDSCLSGEYGSIDLQGCIPCPLGSYQSKARQTYCDPCPSGYSTLETGSKGSEQCLVDCGSGYEYNYISQSCDICPLGYFRDALTHAHCYQCPVGMTTVAKGSTYCVEEPDDVGEKEDERVMIESLVIFDVDSCENEPVVSSVIKQTLNGLVKRTASEWPLLCHEECYNLQLHKYKNCIIGRKGPGGHLWIKVRLDNVSLSTDNGQYVRLSSKVLEQALYQNEFYQVLGEYGVRFKGLDGMTTTIVCQNGSALSNGDCDPCHAGTFHNVSSSACQKCPLGTYQNLSEMTSCIECEGATVTITSGAESASQCVSPCDAKPGFCHNGGVCHWSEEDKLSLYCQCFDGYTGDRCDVITDPYVDTGVIIGSSIGAVMVILLFILIIVAFVACVRYAKIKKRHNSVGVLRQGHPSSLNRSAVSSKAYIISNRSRGHRFLDHFDYYNWLYFTHNYFLSPTHQAQQLQLSPNEFKLVPTSLPHPPRYCTALPSPNPSGESKGSKFTGVEY